MEIIYKDINELIPYKNNPRINDDAAEYVAESIKEFGFKVPVVIDKDNVIVAGHTRLKAAKSLHIKDIPCIVADDLTDEQIAAFRLADNKVGEMAEWDDELLDVELEMVGDIDMELFGFEFDYETVTTHEENVETTQQRVLGIHNLDIATFNGVGKYDIPQIEPVTNLPEINEWIGFNYVLSDTDSEEEKMHKGVHFFIDDYQFERLWNNPENYVDALKQYGVVCAPDFSPYGDMPMATQIFNHYRKHWVGAYLQQNGVTVIPTIRSSTDDRSLEWYLDGEPQCGIVMISSMWCHKEEVREKFDVEFSLMKDRLSPSKIFVYGNEVDGLTDVQYISSFTKKRWG